MRTLLVLTALLPLALPRAARAAEAQPAIAVTEFLSDAGDREKAKGLSAVVSARLASFRARVVGMDEISAALNLEKQKQMLGCSEESCLQEISGALGVRYLVHGRLDRFGKSALLNAFLFDARAARSLLRWSQRVEDDAQLVVEAEKFAVQAAAALGLDQPQAARAGYQLAGPSIATSAAPAPVLDPDFHLNLKLGNTLGSLRGATLSAFSLRFDLEADYYLSPRWQIFAQAGVVIGTASDATGADPGEKTFRLFPAFAGLKRTFRAEQDLRPYASLGLGLGIINKVFQSSSGDTVGLNSQGVVGLAWVPARHVGMNLEASVNLAGISSGSGGVYFGFNTNFGLMALF